MAGLTAERGRNIRKEYSEIKEKLICDKHGLKQIGGSKTKIDGSNGIDNVSIKNASGNSTQVHLTTQNHFIKYFKIIKNSKKFIELFCGNPNIKNGNKDRYTINEIDEPIKKSFNNFLCKNKNDIINLIIGKDITYIIFNDLKNNIEYKLSHKDIKRKIKNTNWVFLKGAIHLKNNEGKTYFHFQRESKSNPNNRYNILFHIHKNIFL
jgi:hypothetical protein